MNPWNEILEDFDLLTLQEKKSMIQKLQKVVEEEEDAPEETELEEAWKDIQRDVAFLKREPYIDDQVEIEDAWNICEDLIKEGNLKNESWDLRERILEDIIENDMYDYYGLMDPMEDLMKALCTTKDEKLRFADMIYRGGSGFMREYGAEIYRDNGQPQKYYDYLEHGLGRKAAPYKELIDYYRESAPSKADQIAELALKKCGEEQTDFMIYLLDRAKEMGDEEKYQKLLKGAQRRRMVNYSKVQKHLEETS